ncbi:transporter [Polaribacter pacificus]|uniref:Transporter n=1 Tax=Polaribacter pacificus TaxID=1775173 RepID=A0A917HZI1_9FLAO|nr:TolC family protein [Polaribacter pacificus]GGG98383.1 transporter [Polaribacter pacificus]
MKRIFLFFFVLLALPSTAQQSITIEACYNLAAKNYPLSKQSHLLASQNKLDTEIISKTKLPQFSVNAQATYQSDVVEIPIPNVGVTPLNKDQYRATLSVNQLIYNGKIAEASTLVKLAQLKTKQKQVEINLYQLKQQINQLYFSILLTQESKLLIAAKQVQLRAKLKEVKSGISQGIILPSSDKILEAELLQSNQQLTSLEATKMTLIKTLSSLLGIALEPDTLFQKPQVSLALHKELNRPELDLFQLKKEEIESNETLISKQNAPKLFGFATGGYGNPGLNMLDNSFQAFYTVGLTLKWNLFDWDTTKKQRESLAINKDFVENEAEIFKLNTSVELYKQQKEIDKIESFIASDLEIIKLRKAVLKTASSQLSNGVITSSAYTTELTNLYENENTLLRHKILLQLAKANYNVIKGH